jgi:RNA polymerase sigma-70 factor (ECF subfamily)
MLTSAFPISLLDSNPIPTVEWNQLRVAIKCSESDSVARAKAGDTDAFSDLYTKHKRRVLSICLRMVHDPLLAEDLTQETFFQVHRKLGTFRGEAVFTTWLHRLAVNTVLMHLRKHALSVVSLDHLLASVAEDRRGREFGIRDLAQAGIVDRLTIDRAVATLAPGCRSIFLLHDVQGFDHGEIASMLQCTRGNTKSQLHKARQALRGALAAPMGPGRDGATVRVRNPYLPKAQTSRRHECFQN